MIPEEQREAILRLTLCARRQCQICKYNKRKRVRVKIPQDCEDRITKSMNILAKALEDPASDMDIKIEMSKYVEGWIARVIEDNNGG